MVEEVAVVFTAKSIERILREGGTSAWRLDRNHARLCKYVVCTRNAHAKWVEGPEEHHSAFLVGKIRDVVWCQPTPENQEARENRFLIQFSEFARVNVPNFWTGDRNPIKYISAEKIGINFSEIEWKRMPEVSEESPLELSRTHDGSSVATKPLTMAEAKKGLALTFNVPPEAIEITIRG